MRIPLLFLVCLFSGSLLAQQPKPTTEEGSEAEMVRRKQAALGEVNDGALPKEKQAEWDSLTPEQRLARNVMHGAGTHLRMDVAVHPARLLPGQTGMAKVTLTLLGDAVIPSPAPLTWQTAAIQGDVSLGSATLLPARSSNVAKGYAGQVVYDAWAIAELPITMAPTAKMGAKVPFRVSLTVDLYSGTSAQVIGRFVDHASGSVEVGQSHDPAVLAGQSKAAEDASGSTPAATGSDSPEGPKADPRSAERTPAVRGEVPTPETPTESAVRNPADAEEDQGPAEMESGSLPVPLLLVGGAVLLVLLVLVARRR